MRPNLNYIKENGVENHVRKLNERMKLLEEMLGEFNDGRSKSFYCTAATLLSVESIKEAINYAKKKVEAFGVGKEDLKGKAKILREALCSVAKRESVDLKLRKPPKKGK